MATQTIYTGKDCYTYENQPDTNKNDSRLVIRGRSGYRRRTFIEFDITSAPVASLVSSVKIYLHLEYDGNQTFTGRFNRITGSWTETGITWNNAPVVTATNQITHSMVATPAGWYNYDITDIYKDAKNAGNECGIRIMDHNEYNDSHNNYSSREGSYDPYIVITYTSSTDYYVKTSGNDVADGQSWANAWATINKAATTVPDGSTVHLEHGTYNAEPAANKIAPQNAGASGIGYKPEPVGGGAGAATVTVERN